MLVVCTPFEFHVPYSVNWGTGPLSPRLLFIGGVLGGGGTSGSNSGPNF